MQRKLLMGSKKKTKFYVIPKMKSDNGVFWSVESNIYPENKEYLRFQSGYTSPSWNQERYYYTMFYMSVKYDSIILTRLDNGKSLNLSYDEYSMPNQGEVGYSSKESSNAVALFTKTDIDKTIEITIEPAGGGLIGFFRRFVTFLRGGLRNAKKNDANEQHSIANWSRGICDSSTNNKYDCSKGLWICVGSAFKFSYRKYQSSILSRARNTLFDLWISRVIRRWHVPCFWRYTKTLSAYICPTIRQFSDIQTGSNSNGKLRRLFIHIVKKYIFTRGRRKRNPCINPWRIASSALCAGGCHA